MSPAAGFVLLEKIAPRLRHIIPTSVKPVGGEDTAELVQDSLVVAAQMLHRLEQQGKEVTPGNICYYVTLLMKTGRRSYGSGRTDAMAVTTQLDGKSTMYSLEEPASVDFETGEEIPLGDLLASHAEDPSQCATRAVDWDEFLDQHNPRYRAMVQDMVRGKQAKETAARFGFGSSWAHELKKSLAEDLRAFMGEEVMEDVMLAPVWRANIVAEHEKMACRAERRRLVTQHERSL